MITVSYLVPTTLSNTSLMISGGRGGSVGYLVVSVGIVPPWIGSTSMVGGGSPRDVKFAGSGDL